MKMIIFNRKKFFAAFLFGTLACFGVLGAKSVIVEENPDLENALIIDGIKMDSGDFDDSFSGDVIYRIDSEAPKNQKAKAKESASAKKSPPVQEKNPSQEKNQEKEKNQPSGSTIMQQLRGDDPRWHLSQYTIKSGDNLWSIAKKFETDHKLILKVNDIKNPSHLLDGKNILVPNKLGCYHNVKKGDTLISISQRYKADRDSIVSVNSIKGDSIRAGQRLFIPDGREPSARKNVKQNTVIAKTNNVKPKAKQPANLITFAWPLKGKITSGFGTRRDPFDGTTKFHSGIDISVNEGTQVKASRGGTVILSGWKDGYGNTIILRHEDGYITVYAHNLKTVVEEGTFVQKGQLIALSGQTGAVTGAHLHFEIRKYLTLLDPMRFLK